MFVLFQGPVCLKCVGDAASRDHERRVLALSFPDVLLDTPPRSRADGHKPIDPEEASLHVLLSWPAGR